MMAERVFHDDAVYTPRLASQHACIKCLKEENTCNSACKRVVHSVTQGSRYIVISTPLGDPWDTLLRLMYRTPDIATNKEKVVLCAL